MEELRGLSLRPKPIALHTRVSDTGSAMNTEA